MSNLKKLELNKEGVKEFLKSEEIMQELLRQAQTQGEIEASYRNATRCVVKVKTE